MNKYDPPSHAPAFCVSEGLDAFAKSWFGHTTCSLYVILLVPFCRVNTCVGPSAAQNAAPPSSPLREVPRTGITPANAGKAIDKQMTSPPTRPIADFINNLLRIEMALRPWGERTTTLARATPFVVYGVLLPW